MKLLSTLSSFIDFLNNFKKMAASKSFLFKRLVVNSHPLKFLNDTIGNLLTKIV